MNTSIEGKAAVAFADGRFDVRLGNGVSFSFPIAGNWRLEGATREQLANVEVDEDGLHWPEIDEDLSFAGLLRGDWGQFVRTPAEAEALATRLMGAIRLKEKYRTDAVHMALAAIRGADLLLSWNCKHIANSATIPKVVATLALAGYACPAIATPRQRLEERDND